MAGLAATVRVGDVERSQALLDLVPPIPLDLADDELVVGDTERMTTLALHRLQTGDAAGARGLLELVSDQLEPAIDPNVHSALALVCAAGGDTEAALRHAVAVEAHDRATYLDRTTAAVARGFALRPHG